MRGAAARQALVLRTQRHGTPRVERNSDRVEDWGGRVGRHNFRAAGVGRMVGEGQDRAVHHTELVPEGERTRTVEQVVVQVDSLFGYIDPEVGGHREHLDPGSRS